MNDNVMIQGLIMGMEDQGCKFIKKNGDCIYFEIPSTLQEKSMQSVKVIFECAGLRLFTKVV